MEDDTDIRMKNQIVCRIIFKDLLKAVDLPRMILQIAAVDGDVIFLNMRRPRDMVGRFSFRMNIELLVGFLFFALQIFYNLMHNDHMNPTKRTVLILFVISGFTLYFLMLELYLSIPRGLPEEERRRARLIGWFQETVMILVLVPMVYWILQKPVLTLMPTPT
ncbi:uncharacterized protein LOC8289774 isoform X2 [Ricinus communis]|uniref:uncharacterized protein LOC8289774 isoform X2 n=1 Tax=Ricinus communis TaxID=3988 RepID=UPI0007723B67|nr:uncharacterized protein LOC8289774 isoform X2 [Ricinus communis]|eukprot:XP_015578096.1 uncharacterized protein LOC8289774 isoform X2 [Ricinus communis]